jgi:H+/Cl- antiporter ClcA
MSDPAPKAKPANFFFLKNVPWYQQVAAGWPLILVLVGGALGGACGAAAYYFNAKIMKSNVSRPLKYVYTVLVGLGAILTYLLTIGILAAMFPQLFAAKTQ